MSPCILFSLFFRIILHRQYREWTQKIPLQSDSRIHWWQIQWNISKYEYIHLHMYKQEGEFLQNESFLSRIESMIWISWPSCSLYDLRNSVLSHRYGRCMKSNYFYWVNNKIMTFNFVCFGRMWKKKKGISASLLKTLQTATISSHIVSIYLYIYRLFTWYLHYLN